MQCLSGVFTVNVCYYDFRGSLVLLLVFVFLNFGHKEASLSPAAADNGPPLWHLKVSITLLSDKAKGQWPSLLSPLMTCEVRTHGGKANIDPNTGRNCKPHVTRGFEEAAVGNESHPQHPESFRNIQARGDGNGNFQDRRLQPSMYFGSPQNREQRLRPL